MGLLDELFASSSEIMQIGLSENEQYSCVVYFDKQEEIQTHWFKKTGPDDRQALDYFKDFPHPHRLIRPIPNQYIWRKYIFMPLDSDYFDIRKTINRTVEKELPIPLNQLCIQHSVELSHDERSLKVGIFALKETYAEKLEDNNLRIVLDCEYHCYMRGYHYSNHYISTQDTSGYIYQLRDELFQFTHDGFVRHTPDSYTLTTSDFVFDYHACFLDFDLIDPNLYLLALGACLWAGND